MMLELTNKWAVELVVCSNLETLGIDDNDPEVLMEVMQACEQVFDKLLNNSWSFVKEDSFFANWNGGMYRKQGYCEGHFAFDFSSRITFANDDEVIYGDWYWVSLDSVPPILRTGLQLILEKCNNAIDTVISAYEAEQV